MLRFLPWRSVVRRAARAYGIMDPALWLARLRQFSQPSEVQEPIELLRAGIHFHARGLINTKAIQHNLDWVWPYWVERQFDPHDASFIPRAFSFSHINLTHRNWTAVGLPDLPIVSLVDPRGLVTPLHDGWSIDFWVVDQFGDVLYPSRSGSHECQQVMVVGENQVVETITSRDSMSLKNSTRLKWESERPLLEIDSVVSGARGGSLVVAIRPYNPEGIQFVDEVKLLADGAGWRVNQQTDVLTSRPADSTITSHYDHGDVAGNLSRSKPGQSIPQHSEYESCDQGMATAASLFRIDADRFQLRTTVCLEQELRSQGNSCPADPCIDWAQIRTQVATLQVPDERFMKLYDSAVVTLTLLSAGELVPGPYTYRRFWFRDACLMMNPMLSIGLVERCRRHLSRFPSRQQRDGYFRSQQGEWDSNGQVLWILNQFRKLTGEQAPDSLLGVIRSALRWIEKKRVDPGVDCRHAGLMPAGFSAEHLGPNDHYYWDAYWSEAGARAAAELLEEFGQDAEACRAIALADSFLVSIDRSLSKNMTAKSARMIPASPYRRMDAGSIGSLVADYPLRLTAPDDAAIWNTADHLLRKHFVNGGFFQDMVHSGINAYLTLNVAQTLLRHGDTRFQTLIENVAQLASPTGQWPEAIHPQTLGGCMGDGQHGWAAAEWVMMMRNCFVREEQGGLIIGSGIFTEWMQSRKTLSFGPTLTPWGAVSVRIEDAATEPVLFIDAKWRHTPPSIEIRVPGYEVVSNASSGTAVALKPKRQNAETAALQDTSTPGVTS
ncbi:MAG: hypothetical protein R3C20_11710 [Planctomycetaceae bacterium]